MNAHDVRNGPFPAVITHCNLRLLCLREPTPALARLLLGVKRAHLTVSAEGET